MYELILFALLVGGVAIVTIYCYFQFMLYRDERDREIQAAREADTKGRAYRG